MTTSTTRLTAILATAAVLLTANAAFAKNNGNNNGNHSNGNNKNSSFKLSFGSNPSKKSSVFSNPSKSVTVFKKDNNDKHDSHKPCFDGHCYPKYNFYSNYCYPTYGCIRPLYVIEVGRGFEPFHSTYICQPGDSLVTISLKEYGISSNWRAIAQFNRMAGNSPLVPGQQLMLPSISASGALSLSRAPAMGMELGGMFNPANSGPVNAMPNFTTPASFTTPSNTTNPAAPPRTKVAVGSTLLVEGQSFGDKSGAARLSVSGMLLPVEVVEWTPGAVKIHLPQLEITGVTLADIEVLRADGSLASKTPVELTTASMQVAIGK